MKKLPELYVKKGLFITILILSIALFSLGLILDIVNIFGLVQGAQFSSYEYWTQRYGFDSNWALYVSLIIDAILCMGFVFASSTILLWDPDNYGGTLLCAAGLYAVINGFVSAISGIMLSICYADADVTYYAVSAVISIIQIGIGSKSLIVRNRKPGAAIIIGIFSFCVFALNNLLTAIGYEVARRPLFSVFPCVAIAFDVVIIVALCMVKEADPAAAPHENTPLEK